jgi:hypothetical protein
MQMPQLGADRDSLKKIVSQFCTNAIADSTRKVYQTGFRTFIQFLVIIGLYSAVTGVGYPPAITVETLIYFAGHCAQFLKLRHDTIKLYLAGVRYHYIIHDVVCPLSTPYCDLSKLHLVLRGIKKSQNNSTFKRLPITGRMLNQLVVKATMVFSAYVSLLINTASTMAFYGFLRCGEFTLSQAGDTNYLRLADILMDNNMFELALKASKTDVFRQGVAIKVYANHTSHCPVNFMRRFVSLRIHAGATPQDPLFLDENEVIMSKSYFVSKLRFLLTALGYDSTNFNGHSLRIGAASTAGDRGLSDYTIQTLGRWRSDCYLRYIRLAPETIAEAQMCMSTV